MKFILKAFPKSTKHKKKPWICNYIVVNSQCFVYNFSINKYFHKLNLGNFISLHQTDVLGVSIIKYIDYNNQKVQKEMIPST